MNVVSRGVRNAFRSPARTIAVIAILGLTIGLSFSMLIGHKSVQSKIGTTLASIGNTVNITPVGYATGSTENNYLTTGQLSKIAHLRHVVSLDEALPGSLPPGRAATRPADAGTTLRLGSAGEPVSFVGTNEPTAPSDIGASTLTLVAGQVIDGTGDSDDAMVSTTMARRNHLKVGSAFRAYGAILTVKALFQSDTDNGNDTVILPLMTEQRLSHRDSKVTSVVATVDSLANLSAVTGAITATLGPAADVTSDIARAGQALAPLQSVKSLSLYSLFGAVGAAAVIIFLVMVMTVRERKREVGIVKAIGGSNASIVFEFMAEALTFAILGGTAGLIAGALAASAITTSLVGDGGNASSPTSLSRAQNPALWHLSQLHATATAPEVLIGLAGIGLIAAFGSAAASYLISRIQPAEVLRSE
jgi:putative ABC transport system permease protein